MYIFVERLSENIWISNFFKNNDGNIDQTSFNKATQTVWFLLYCKLNENKIILILGQFQNEYFCPPPFIVTYKEAPRISSLFKSWQFKHIPRRLYVGNGSVSINPTEWKIRSKSLLKWNTLISCMDCSCSPLPDHNTHLSLSINSGSYITAVI